MNTVSLKKLYHPSFICERAIKQKKSIRWIRQPWNLAVEMIQTSRHLHRLLVFTRSSARGKSVFKKPQISFKIMVKVNQGYMNGVFLTRSFIIRCQSCEKRVQKLLFWNYYFQEVDWSVQLTFSYTILRKETRTPPQFEHRRTTQATCLESRLTKQSKLDPELQNGSR